MKSRIKPFLILVIAPMLTIGSLYAIWFTVDGGRNDQKTTFGRTPQVTRYLSTPDKYKSQAESPDTSNQVNQPTQNSTQKPQTASGQSVPYIPSSPYIPPPDTTVKPPTQTKTCRTVQVGDSSYTRTVCDGDPLVDQVCMDAATGRSLPPGYTCR